MAELHFGPAGWHYEDWRGWVYPERRPRGFHPLPFLARYVNLVEVNATFYGAVKAATAEEWVRRLEAFPDFRFVIKVWERLTHAGNGLPDREAVAEWAQVLAPLEASGRLLAVLVQFPFSFRAGRAARERLLRIRDLLGGRLMACEFRHASFAEEETLEFLRGEGMAFVNIDQPLGRESLPPTAMRTAPLAYVRLHGRNREAWFDRETGRDERYDYHYGRAELAEWAERLRILSAGRGSLLVVGNNHYHGKGLAAVLSLAHLLTGEKFPVPERLAARFPELERIRRPEAGELF